MSDDHPLVQTRTLGRWRLHAIRAGEIRLDGGAMFGVVPKPLWQRRIAPDDRNRIPLTMRCLLVEHDEGPILIDNGVGNKEDAKFHDIYGVENAGAGGRTRLDDALDQIGVRREDVAMVINTHLHFDHAGGNTYRDASGAVRPAFPNARYIVQRGEYEFATHTNERTAASYFAPNFVPIADAGLFEFVEGDIEAARGIRLVPTPGHTPYHQSVLLDGGGAKALFLADLAPTTAHIPLPWIMGYDVEPLVTLETKRRILARALREQWALVFEHDATTPWGQLAFDGKAYSLLEQASSIS